MRSDHFRTWPYAGTPLPFLLPLAIALATGLDYFDNAIFSFFIGHMAGGVNAAPDELIWSSSAYAVASVLGILRQQWWVDHIGYRRYLSACLLLFSIGSVAAALSSSSVELAAARGFQGYFIGPMMGACRIFLRTQLPAARQPGAVRLFLFLILSASAAAPLAGGFLIAAFSWKALFVCTALAGAALAAFVAFVVPHAGHKQPEDRTDAHVWPYVVFALAQGALQIAMQQVRYELFSTSPALVFLSIGGTVLLIWFGWHQWHHPKPLMRLHALRDKAFQAGIVLYIFFYFSNTTLSYLISRLLENGLGYPVENAGRLIGMTSLISLPVALVYFRYSAQIKHKKLLIIPGFVLTVFIGIWLANMSPDVSFSWLILPMILRGLLLMFIALPVAGVTFSIFATEEFTHGYRFKNIVKQLTNSFATTSIITLEQHRFALHYARLNEQVSSSPAAWQQWLSNLQVQTGTGAEQSARLAIAELSRLVNQQANFMSLMDGFWVVAAIAAIGMIFALVQKRIQ